MHQNPAAETADPAEPSGPEGAVATAVASAPSLALMPAAGLDGLSPAAAAALAAGVPDATRVAYELDWRRFAAWCAGAGRTALPAGAATLVEYATHLAYTQALAPATIARSLSAIRTLHRLAEAPPPDTLPARAVLRGYLDSLAQAKDPRARPRRAAPAVPKALRAMLATRDRERPAGARDAAVLLLGFAVAGRRSELAALDLADLAEVEAGLEVSVYRTKTRRLDAVAVLYGTDPATCPVRATRAWRQLLAERGRTAGPLFVRIDRHGRLGHVATGRGHPDGRLSGQAIAQIVTRAATAAGLAGPPGPGSQPARWSGHSLRRGLPTAARQAGHDLLRIGRHGGWADGSRSLAAYIDEVDRWSADNPLVGVGL